MKHWIKKASAVMLAGCLTAGMAGCADAQVDNSEIVATVGSDEISYGVANFYARMEQASVEYYYESLLGGTVGTDMWITEVEDGVTYEESVKDSIMEYLQNLYLIKQHAAEYDVALTEEDHTAITEAIAVFDEDNSLEDKEVVSGEEEYVREYLELLTLQAKMDAPMKEGVDEEVSDEEAAQKSMKYVYFEFYTTDEDGNQVDMTDDEKEDLIASAEDFAAALKEGTSDIDTLAAEEGVEVTSITFDAETASPNTDLIAAADALEAEGDVTDIIESDYGVYVAVLTSLMDEEATEEEKLVIVEERKQEQYDALLTEWREATEITVNEEVWSKLDFEEIGVTYKDSSEEYDDVTAE
ncbi:MAG: peptidyl-prolyl cis-trans isomerase [Ruminococcus sp.]|nr:peptidyl-prolyl cis-trans isomerase [Ruminococcus sp.]